jgi:hypothetical protein
MAVLLAASAAACSDRQEGAGEFAIEMSYCQEQIFADAQQTPGMTFYEEHSWHSGEKSELYLGGMLSVPDMRQRPVFFEYECKMRGWQLIYARQ